MRAFGVKRYESLPMLRSTPSMATPEIEEGAASSRRRTVTDTQQPNNKQSVSPEQQPKPIELMNRNNSNKRSSMSDTEVLFTQGSQGSRLNMDRMDSGLDQSQTHLDHGDGVDMLSMSNASSMHNTLNEDTVNEMIKDVAARGRLYGAARQRPRLVHKTGDCNILLTNVSARKRRFIVDIFNTMLDLKWRYNLLVFVLAFIITWFVFGIVWWIIAIIHDDPKHLEDGNWTMCMNGVYDFPTALLFSIETQHTIGYGTRSMEDICAEAFIVLMLQSALGVFMQSLVTGLIFAKISRPKTRAQTVMFSRYAVITQRDGDLVLLFRIGDMRRSHIIASTIRAIMVQNRLTKEGEIIPLCQVPLVVESESSLAGDNYVFLAWPVTVSHRITRESPLWHVSAAQLVDQKFEIVVILDGTIESSGSSIQLRSSYLPTEILWGHHLAPLVTFQKTDGQYCVDFTQFHNTVPHDLPEDSAAELYEKTKINATIEQPVMPQVNFTFTTAASSAKKLRKKHKGLKGRKEASPLESVPMSLKRRFTVHNIATRLLHPSHSAVEVFSGMRSPNGPGGDNGERAAGHTAVKSDIDSGRESARGSLDEGKTTPPQFSPKGN